MMPGSRNTLPGRPSMHGKRSSLVVAENKRRSSTVASSCRQHAQPRQSADSSAAAEQKPFGGRVRGSMKYDPELLEELLKNHSGQDKEEMRGVKDSLDSCVSQMKSQVYSLYSLSEEPNKDPSAKLATSETPSQELEASESEKEVCKTIGSEKEIDIADTENQPFKKNDVRPVRIIPGRPRNRAIISSPRDSGDEEEDDEDDTALPFDFNEVDDYLRSSTVIDEYAEDSDDHDEDLGPHIIADEAEAYNLQICTLHVRNLLREFKTEKRMAILEDLASFYARRIKSTAKEAVQLELMEEDIDAEGRGEDYDKMQLRSELEEGEKQAYTMLNRYCNHLQEVTLPRDAEKASATQQAERSRLKKFREELHLASGNIDDTFVQNPSDVLEVAAMLYEEIEKMRERLSMETSRLQAYEHGHKVIFGAIEKGSDAPMEDYVTAQVIREVRKWELDGATPEQLDDMDELKQTADQVKAKTERLKLEYQDLQRRVKREEALNSKRHRSRGRKTIRMSEKGGIQGDIFWQPSGWKNILLMDEDVQNQYKWEIQRATEANNELEHFITAFGDLPHVASMQVPDYEECLDRVHEILKSSKAKPDKEIGSLPAELSPEAEELDDFKVIYAEMDREKEDLHQQKLEEMEQQVESLTWEVQKERKQLHESQDKFKKRAKPLLAMQKEITVLQEAAAGGNFGTNVVDDVQALDTEGLITTAIQRNDNYSRLLDAVRDAAFQSIKNQKARAIEKQEKQKARRGRKQARTQAGRKNSKVAQDPQSQNEAEDRGENTTTCQDPQSQNEEEYEGVHRTGEGDEVAQSHIPPKDQDPQSQNEAEDGGENTTTCQDPQSQNEEEHEAVHRTGEGDEVAQSHIPPEDQEKPPLRRPAMRGSLPADKTSLAPKEAASLESRLATPDRMEEAVIPRKSIFAIDNDDDRGRSLNPLEKTNRLFQKFWAIQKLIDKGTLHARIEDTTAKATSKKTMRALVNDGEGKVNEDKVEELTGSERPTRNNLRALVSRARSKAKLEEGDASTKLEEAINVTVKTVRAKVNAKRKAMAASQKEDTANIIQASEAAVAKMAERSPKP